MQFNIFFKRLKSLLPLVFPFFLLLGILSIVIAEIHTSFLFSLFLPVLVVINIFQFIILLVKNKKTAIFNLSVLVLFFICFDFFYQFNFEEDKKTNDTFSIMSYNSNSFRHDSIVNNGIVDALRGIKPDILFCQEFSYFKLDGFKTYPFRFIGYRREFKKSLQVVLSKYPIKNKGYIDFPKTRNNAMFVDVEINDRVIRVYNLHLESFKLDVRNDIGNLSSSYKYLLPRFVYAEEKRIAQANVVRNHINNFDGDVIVLGDFNSTQYSSVYRILKGDREDTFVAQGSGFGSTFKLLNYPFKVDHILVDPSFEVVRHENFNLQLSDHEPVLAELRFKN
jgi:endonuclease/exonuclease/phosphatase family metal-dependent hydrolase